MTEKPDEPAAEDQPETPALSPREEIALAALISSPTIAAAARTSGVHERTLRTMLTRGPLADAWRAARLAAVAHSSQRLAQATTRAVETLEAVMGDAAAPHSARVQAARAVLDHVASFELVDLSQRLDALEAAKENA
jgi:hypothetical protein